MSEMVLELLNRDLLRCREEHARLEVQLSHLKMEVRSVDVKIEYITETLKKLGVSAHTSPFLQSEIIIPDEVKKDFRNLPLPDFIRRVMMITGDALSIEEIALFAVKFEHEVAVDRDPHKLRGLF